MFENIMLGDFTESTKEKKIRELAIKYVKVTEGYDSVVCSGIDQDGNSMPLNMHERSLSNNHATNYRRKILAEAIDNGVTSKEMAKGIRNYRHTKTN